MKKSRVVAVRPFNDGGRKYMQEHNIPPTYDETYAKERLSRIFAGGGHHCSFISVCKFGYEKIMGVQYDYKPFLQRILVKQYGRWEEYYAPNKTALRSCLYGTIQEMVYVKQRSKNDCKK